MDMSRNEKMGFSWISILLIVLYGNLKLKGVAADGVGFSCDETIAE